MPGTSVESLQNLNSAAVLKFHVGGLLIADNTAATPNEATLVGADGTLDATQLVGYKSAGLVTTDGLTFGRAMTSDDTNSWQTLAVIRTDITADAITVKVKLQESNTVTMALQEGLTLAQVASQFTSAGYSGKRDSSGRQPQRKGLLVAKDTKYNITLVRIFPNFSYSDQGDQAVGRATELMYDATFKALYDTAYGSDAGLAINGPGWAALSGQTAPAWAATSSYALNATIALTTGGGGVVKATTAGTTGSTQPTLPGAVGGTVTDGTVVWTRQS